MGPTPSTPQAGAATRCGVAWSLILGLLALQPAGLHAPKTQHIVDGTDAVLCDFPAAIQIIGQNAEGDQGPVCSGALMHPQILVTAAHCIVDGQELVSLRFGENSVDAPSRSVEITGCVGHPEFDAEFRNDIAVCSLAEPVDDVPIVPPLMGCEAGVLQPGFDVLQVGYGRSSLEEPYGSGVKRWAPKVIQAFQWTENDLVLVNTGQGNSCLGDSGGPTYVQLPDGTWRVAAVLSTGHPQTTVGCELGSVVERLDGLMPWIEEAVGTDITPCHDADGTWNPGPDCHGFPTELFAADGQTWDAGCVGAARSGFAATCGDPFEPEVPETTGGDETGGPTSGGFDTERSTTNAGATDAGGADAGTVGMSGVGTTDDDGQTSGGGAADADSEGCGCNSDGSGPGAAALFLLVVAGLRPRTRTRRAR